MEQIDKTDRKPFAHMKKPCSIRMEQFGTNGTIRNKWNNAWNKPNLLTRANKFVRLQHHHLHRKLSSKKSHQKKPLKMGNKKTPIARGLPNPCGLDNFDFCGNLGSITSVVGGRLPR